MSSDARSLSDLSMEGPTEHPYKSVFVLLCRWKDDDLGVRVESEQLDGVFSNVYGFVVQHFLIPSNEPDDAFAEALQQFVQSYQDSSSLLVVYYGGHGGLNHARQAQWYCHNRAQSPELKWYSHQRMLENSLSDVLLLLDCCKPLGPGGSIRAGTSKEVLTACGFSRATPGVGEHSFTKALIEELVTSAPEPFNTNELHSRMTNRLRTRVLDQHGEQRENPVLSLMGEGGQRNLSIKFVSFTHYPINLVALMGATGSGKSSLINRICGREVASVDDGQESVTKEVTQYTAIVNREVVTLIDTPGFDDTSLSDREVLERISASLYNHYHGRRKLSGLLFLRDITVQRMTNTAVKNLSMFHSLCGDESLKNVMFLTTKWDKAPAFAVKHEQELTEKFWAGMLKLGCSGPKRLGGVANHSSGIADPISDIIAPILKFKPTWLQIQRQLGTGKQLGDTTAGQMIDQDLSREIQKYQESFESTLAEIQHSHEHKIRAALQEQAAKFGQHLAKAKFDREMLKADFEERVKADKWRRKEFWVSAVIGAASLAVVAFQSSR